MGPTVSHDLLRGLGLIRSFANPGRDNMRAGDGKFVTRKVTPELIHPNPRSHSTNPKPLNPIPQTSNPLG